jgi:putative oxidoreductase
MADTQPSITRIQQAFLVVRLVASGTLVVHGLYRLFSGGVDPFGSALVALAGLPVGVALATAWTITVIEIVGGTTLALGRLVRPLSLWFASELTMGIVLVHAPAGWFVVGGGRNGMEYSVVLIILFLCLAWVGSPRPETASLKTKIP